MTVLTPINPGDDADADVLNDNFEALEDLIGDNYTELDGRIDSLGSSITSINTTLSSGVVKTTGTQTVGGAKTFTSNLTISKGSSPKVVVKNTDETAGTVPGAAQYCSFQFQDSAGTTIGNIANVYAADGSRSTYLYTAYPNGTAASTDDFGILRLTIDSDGNAYATCPTPPAADDDSRKIATTSWVNARFKVVDASSVDEKVLYDSKADDRFFNVEDDIITVTDAASYYWGVQSNWIRLSERFDNFAYLIIIGGNSDGNAMTVNKISTHYLLEAWGYGKDRPNTASWSKRTFSLIYTPDNRWWCAYTNDAYDNGQGSDAIASGETFNKYCGFKNVSVDARIRKIYGVNRIANKAADE